MSSTVLLIKAVMGLYHVLMNVRTYAHTYVHAYVCTNEPTRMHGCTSINAWMGWRMYCNVMYWKLECKATQCSAMVGYGLVWYGTARYGMYIWSHTHTHTLDHRSAKNDTVSAEERSNNHVVSNSGHQIAQDYLHPFQSSSMSTRLDEPRGHRALHGLHRKC